MQKMMRTIRLILLIICALLSPKAWNGVKGVSAHQLSQQLLPKETLDKSSLKSIVLFGPRSNFRTPLTYKRLAPPSKLNPDQKYPIAFKRALTQSLPNVAPIMNDRILSQPFFYWGKGSQFYVFFSQDGEYVLKIPRASKLRQSFLDRICHRKMSKPDVLRSMQIAIDCLSEECALVAVHCGYSKTSNSLSFALFDSIHRRIPIDLQHTPFALQKRHKLLIRELLEANDSSEVQKKIIAYLDLISIEKSKGFMSRDSAFWQNFAIQSGKVFRIDIGSYVCLDDCFSWQKTTKPLRHYLRSAYPSFLSWFDEEIAKREKM